MAQNYNANCYVSGNIGQTDLLTMERNFNCLKTMFSGSSSPTNPVAGMPWFDTTNKILKIRNDDNTSWLGIFLVDVDHKIWIYNDSAPDGWAIDSTNTDCLAALEGGSQSYDVSAAAVSAGEWQLPLNTSDSHRHKWIYQSGSYDYTYASDGNAYYDGTNKCGAYARAGYRQWILSNSGRFPTSYTNGLDIEDAIDLGDTWRPQAAVGTMQYIDL